MKVLKTAALVVLSVVAFATGNPLLGVALAAAAVGSAVGMLAAKPSTGGSQTKWKADPYAGLPYVMGRTLCSGNIIYRRGHGNNNTFQTFVTALSIGPILSIDTTFMDKGTVAFGSGGAAIGTYSGQIWQKTQLGATPESAALVPPVDSPPGWTSAHKLSGLAAVMNSFAYDAKSKTGLTSIPLPAHIVHGVSVYDPRLDSTYPGGSGSCRALDESTYVYSDDPHLHGLTWALGRWQNGKRVAGIGAPGSTIDVAAFVEGANLNEARGWTLGGQVYTRPDTPWNSLKAMLQAGGARPIMVGGQISCINRAPRVSLATITRSDIVGECSFSGTQKRRTRINGIIPQYRSEAHDWELVPADPVIVSAYVTLDGDERTREIAYPLVQDVDQVAQLAAYDICDLREAGPGSVPLKPAWLNYRIGDCVTFAPEEGFSIKTIIEGRSIDAQAGIVGYTLKGETDGKHPFALGQTGTAPPIASITYDPTIAAPTGDWTLSGTTLTSGGTSIPVLVLDGASTNPSADAVVIDYRVYTTGLADDDGWIGASLDAPSITRKEITSVTPGTQYQVGVRYRVRGILGDRAIFGPDTTGSSAIGIGSVTGYDQQLISQSYAVDVDPLDGLLQATSSTITIENHSRAYLDYEIAVDGDTLSVDDTATAIAATTTYHVYYDDPTRAGGTVVYVATQNQTDALNSAANPARHYVGSILTATGSGSTSGGGALPPGWKFDNWYF